MTIVSETEFKKLKRKYTPQFIINLHIKSEIRLSSQQIDELIRMRDGKKVKNARKNKTNTRSL